VKAPIQALFRAWRVVLATTVSGLAMLLGGVLVHAGAESFKLPPETARLKPGPGIELVTSSCMLCHSADYISTQPRLARAAWKASVLKMQQKYGAPIPADKVDAIVEYLVTNYGNEEAAKK
jgi:hypothetical protein